MKKIILALDLGAKTGFCVGYSGNIATSGMKNFDPKKHGGKGRRYLAFSHWLIEIEADYGPFNEVYYEDVKAHAGTLAAHCYGGFLAFLQAWCEDRAKPIPLYGLGVGTVKKNWTGKGNASKAQMIAEAKKRGFDPVDDNHADALAIFQLAIK